MQLLGGASVMRYEGWSTVEPKSKIQAISYTSKLRRLCAKNLGRRHSARDHPRVPAHSTLSLFGILFLYSALPRNTRRTSPIVALLAWFSTTVWFSGFLCNN